MGCGRHVAFPVILLMALSGIRAQVATELRVQTTHLPAAMPATNLRIDSNLVLVPVSVCDSSNRPITGLDKENFRIFDDSVEQTVTQFALEDEPIAVGIIFDLSSSMERKLSRARSALAAFLATANPDDEFFLVEFNEHPKLAVAPTRDTGEISSELAVAQARGRTALLDATVLGLHVLGKSKLRRKALLIVSDGGDNSSRYSARELKERVRESDALIYAIGIYGRAATPEEAEGPELLTSIAEETGARSFTAELNELADIAAKIGLELRNRYVLAYSPTNTRRDGRYHSVQIKLNAPRGLPSLRASWRRGYYDSSE